MKVPAVCDNCSTVFPSSLDLDNIVEATFIGVKSGHCPICGAKGHIPDGVYQFINNTITLLSGTDCTIDDLNKLTNIFRNAKKEKTSRSIVEEKIEKEVPKLSSIKDFLPKTHSDFYAFIAILIAIIDLIINQFMQTQNTKIEIHQVRNIEIHQVINNVYHQEKTDSASQQNKDSFHKKKIGRNETCPCGSGVKYKYCHGR